MYAVVTKDGNVAEFEQEVQARMYADVTGGVWSERRIVQVRSGNRHRDALYNVKEYRLKKLEDGRYVWNVTAVVIQESTLTRIRAAGYKDRIGPMPYNAVRIFAYNPETWK